ncbi:hypothetical protein [Streptomyces avermitilis]|uniref:hypothetical protein n=1 Tax=Streptomyces avermitilis TaxID=33903 RepID=UPI0033AFD582
MNKIVRRIATASASVVVASGALLAAGGSASAATLPADGHTRVAVTVKTDSRDHGRYNHDDSRYRGGSNRGWYVHGFDNCYSNGHGDWYRFDGHRWVADQRATFEGRCGWGHRYFDDGHRYFGNDGHPNHGERSHREDRTVATAE